MKIYFKKCKFNLLFFIFTIGCNGEHNNQISNNNLEQKNNSPKVENIQNKTNENLKVSKEFTIIGVGDIMLGSNYPNNSLLPNSNILKNTENILKDATITVGNLEGTLFDSGGSPKSCSNPAVCYVFRTPSNYGVYLKEAGFDYLSIGNNHSNDFGEKGIIETAKNLDSLGIKYAGIKDKFEWAIIEKDGTKFGFISFSPNSKTVKLNDYEYTKKLVTEVKSKVDILIVMFHGGAEGNKAQHITKNDEIFYGENRGNVFKFAHFVIDHGADIVFGQGPHVTRAIELYKEKFISYSAGNFATYGNFNLKGPSGIAPIFKITIDNNGNFIKGNIISTKQIKGENGPFIDKNNSATKKIIELNNSDFPNGNGFSINEETGEITKK